MENTKEYRLDKRKIEDIYDQLEKLAQAYTPEWLFDRKDPDAGSVIALIFAKQLTDNISRYNRGLEQFHTEFVNMLGISLLPAQPASTMVLFEAAYSTVPGIMVPKGTQMYAYREGDMIIFETEYPIYATSVRLTNAFMVSGGKGHIIPLLGRFESVPVTAGIKEEGIRAITGLEPFPLFQFPDKGIERNALILYHRNIFDVENEDIFLKLPGGSRFLEAYEKGDYMLSYYSEEGLLPVEEVMTDGDLLKLRKYRRNKKTGEGELYSILVFTAKKAIAESIHLSSVLISSAGKAKPVEFANNGTTGLDSGRFAPFGSTLSLFAECFLGHNEYFAKAGAKITLRFHVDMLLHMVRMNREEESGELKVIKRKPGAVLMQPAAEAYAEEISIEYYNGTGWKRLVCEEEYKTLFAEDGGGDMELHFLCPVDWREQDALGYQGRLLRFQIIRADNCYLFPCGHHYPLISGMTAAYSYEDSYEYPDKVEAIYGTRRADLTKQVLAGKEISAFIPGEYNEDALYMGFDRKMEAGPVSILFELEEDIHFTDTSLQFAYYSGDGFQPLRVIDGTESMTKTGCIRFIPPEDMTRHTLEGKNGYWIRISDKKKASQKENGIYPVIQRIRLNAAEVRNVETMREEVFYMDTPAANMEFPLSAQNILDVDLWVNEQETLSDPQMKQMLQEIPEDTKAEYDLQGNIQDFYVRWKEVAQFDASKPADRHYMIDRMNNSVIFGDGVHVRIPEVTKSIAFKATVKSCDGAKGNVAKGSIEGTVKNLNFVDTVTNIYPAYGGSNMESASNALKRGAAVLSSRKRLVTQYDFTREVLASSDNVDKVSCVAGQDKSGIKKEGLISIIILMKDFGENTHAFEKLLPGLKKSLYENCELTIDPDDLRIVEPVPVELSVDSWVRLSEEMDFSIQELLQKELQDYFTPTSTEQGNGWDIGRLPRRTQIMMKLHSLKIRMRIDKLVISGKYKDEQGVHERELEDLPENPFFICKSGNHKVHILAGERSS